MGTNIPDQQNTGFEDTCRGTHTGSTSYLVEADNNSMGTSHWLKIALWGHTQDQHFNG